MRRFIFIALLLTTGCGAAALIPFLEPYISPLVDKIIEYVVGETPEAEFIKDLVDHPEDPAQVIWEQANNSKINPQSKYILGTEDSLGTVERLVGLTFRDSLLYDVNWVDPESTLVGQ